MFRLPHIALLAGAAMAGLLGSMSPQPQRAIIPPSIDLPVARRQRWSGGDRGGKFWWNRSRYMPHQGKRECARRMRQLAAGQISFLKHGPRPSAGA